MWSWIEIHKDRELTSFSDLMKQKFLTSVKYSRLRPSNLVLQPACFLKNEKLCFYKEKKRDPSKKDEVQNSTLNNGFFPLFLGCRVGGTFPVWEAHAGKVSIKIVSENNNLLMIS